MTVKPTKPKSHPEAKPTPVDRPAKTHDTAKSLGDSAAALKAYYAPATDKVIAEVDEHAAIMDRLAKALGATKPLEPGVVATWHCPTCGGSFTDTRCPTDGTALHD